MFSNLTTSIGNMLQPAFVPDGQVLNMQLDEIKTTFTTQFADVFTLYDSVKNASASTFVNRMTGTATFMGHNINFNLNPFNNIPSFVPIVMTSIIYLELAWFLIHKVPELFG
jgi:hypothetical protein